MYVLIYAYKRQVLDWIKQFGIEQSYSWELKPYSHLLSTCPPFLRTLFDYHFLGPKKRKYLHFVVIHSLFPCNLSTFQANKSGRLHFKKWKTQHFSGDIFAKKWSSKWAPNLSDILGTYLPFFQAFFNLNTDFLYPYVFSSMKGCHYCCLFVHP